MATEFNYRVVKEVATISDFGGETKELNLISYNDKPPKYDLRTWKSEGGNRIMCRGITLHKEEAKRLRDALIKELEEE